MRIVKIAALLVLASSGVKAEEAAETLNLKSSTIKQFSRLCFYEDEFGHRFVIRVRSFNRCPKTSSVEMVIENELTEGKADYRKIIRYAPQVSYEGGAQSEKVSAEG